MNEVESIFLRALELPARERPAYLDVACSGNDGTRAQVDDLLRRSAAASEFFGEGPVAEGPPGSAGGDAEDAAEVGEREGSVIGRYRLLQQIGQGGMGVVYMAEQEVPVRRRVALKVVKLGMDTKSVVARFEAERQALAMMDHPNIAKVLDAGTTASGRPYFVMELVHGVPITDYCDQNKLSFSERLNLFIPVCKAIQSAHQKGVIHRDIKPSNILVTLNYGDPMPKVIDFGVAKATNTRLTEKTLFTRFGTMIGTPAYMSPEQAEMSSLDVDTRTDVYALGVLLYELLTGSTPFPAERLRSLGFAQIQKVIAEEEPQQPSTRIKTLPGEAKTSVALRRGLRLDLIGEELRGDLDWIVMKCLEKDRRRRYDTVNDLALDLARHLGNEPVLARPPSAAYRFQKAFRRNRLGFIAIAAVVVALVVGAGFTSWQAVRARRAEALAEDRRADAESITEFLKQVFQSPNPDQSGYAFTVAQALGAAATRLERDLAGMPRRRAELQATLGQTYFAIGLPREAVVLQEKVRDFHQTQSGAEHPDTLAARTVLARSYFESGRREEAIRLHAEVEAIRRRIHGPEHSETLGAMQELANACFYAGQYERAGELQREVLRIRQKSLGPDDPETLRATSALAVTEQSLGHKAESLVMHAQVLATRRRVLGAEHPETLADLSNLASIYQASNRLDEALALQEELVGLRRKVMGPEHPQTLMAMHYLAYYRQSRSPDEAVKLNQEVLALRRQVLGPEHPDTIISIYYIAQNLTALGRTEEALKALEEVLQLRRKSQGPNHPHTANATMELADAQLQAGNTAAAIPLINDCAAGMPTYSPLALRVAALQVWFGQDHQYASFSRQLLERAAAATDPAAQLLEFSVKAASLRAATDPALRDSAFILARRALQAGTNGTDLSSLQFALGLAELRSGQSAEAERTLRTVASNRGREDSLADAASFYRALALVGLGRKEEAAIVFAEAAQAMRTLPDNSPVSEARTDQLIAWLAHKEAKAVLAGDARPVP